MAEFEALQPGGHANLVKDIKAHVANETAEYYAGRSLKTVLGVSTDADLWSALHTMAQAKNGGILRIGDYMDVTPTVSTVNRGNAIRMLLAGIGHNYQYGDSSCPWAFWFLPESPIDMTGSDYAVNTSYIQWNTTNTNQGTEEQPAPYLCSNLHAWELGEYLPALPSALQAYLVNHRILFETRYSSSGALTDSNSWAWGDAGKVFSLSETEVYGQCVWGTKGFSVGCDAQLPLFRDNSRNRIRSRVRWWLRSVRSGSSSDVCCVDRYGGAHNSSATYEWIRARPCFLLG